MRTDLKSLSLEELASFCATRGLESYRAEQLRHWIYDQYAVGISDITVLPMSLRNTLEREAYLSKLILRERVRSRDGTEKYLWDLEDGEAVESVLIPDDDRLTLCISSQAGCAMGCMFCFTASLGLRRNLRQGEIINQIIEVSRSIRPKRVSHVVFMGMGEPLKNLDEVLPALHRITSSRGLAVSRRRVTVSTSGYVPGIERLGREGGGVNLAISLNASCDEVRDRIMPINRRYPLKELLAACRRYPLAPHRRITFEYVMIAGLNDTPDDARRLPGLLRGIRSKINLIPLNSSPGDRYSAPSEGRVHAFQKQLTRAGLTAPIRKSRGADIAAACGQLTAEHRGTGGADIDTGGGSS